MNNNPREIGYFTHELTHAVQQYGNVSSSSKAWWVENMANYGGFRYYHWAHEDTAQNIMPTIHPFRTGAMRHMEIINGSSHIWIQDIQQQKIVMEM